MHERGVYYVNRDSWTGLNEKNSKKTLLKEYFDGSRERRDIWKKKLRKKEKEESMQERERKEPEI